MVDLYPSMIVGFRELTPFQCRAVTGILGLSFF